MKRFLNGFSLVEVTLALGVAAFCLIAVFGLLPLGINSIDIATRQTAATSLLASVASDLQAVPPKPKSTSPRFQVDVAIPGFKSFFLSEDGRMNTSASTDFRYRVTLNVLPAPTNVPKAATAISLRVTWPALVDSDTGMAPKNFAGSVESYVAINRN